MARSVRLVSAPTATGYTATGSWRQLKGSMGAVVPDAGMAPLGSDAGPPDRFEAPAVDDGAWSRELAQRESALGIQSVSPQPRQTNTQVIYSAAPVDPHQNTVNISGLPADFTFHVQQKPDGWWVITSPEQHVGLFVAHQDLLTALTDAPGALAQILRLDGPVPAKRRRRTK